MCDEQIDGSRECGNKHAWEAHLQVRVSITSCHLARKDRAYLEEIVEGYWIALLFGDTSSHDVGRCWR